MRGYGNKGPREQLVYHVQELERLEEIKKHAAQDFSDYLKTAADKALGAALDAAFKTGASYSVREMTRAVQKVVPDIQESDVQSELDVRAEERRVERIPLPGGCRYRKRTGYKA